MTSDQSPACLMLTFLYLQHLPLQRRVLPYSLHLGTQGAGFYSMVLWYGTQCTHSKFSRGMSALPQYLIVNRGITGLLCAR